MGKLREVLLFLSLSCFGALAFGGAAALAGSGCGPQGMIVGHRIACSTPAVLHAADSLADALDGDDKGWRAAVSLTDAIGSTIAGFICDATKPAATHLIADLEARKLAGPAMAPVQCHAVRECHRRRLLRLVQPEPPDAGQPD